MTLFRRRRTEGEPQDVPQEASADDEVPAMQIPENISPKAAEAMAKSLGELADSGVFEPEVQGEIESTQAAWEEKAAQQPELPPDGSDPAA